MASLEMTNPVLFERIGRLVCTAYPTRIGCRDGSWVRRGAAWG